MVNFVSFNNIAPKGVLQKIFLYTGRDSMSSCALVCKAWHRAITDKSFIERINSDFINFVKEMEELEFGSLRQVFMKTFDLSEINFAKEKISNNLDQFFSKSLFKEKNAIICCAFCETLILFSALQ